MKAIILFLSCIYTALASGQESFLKVGETFPHYILQPVVNHSTAELDIHKISNKFIILNFWGTWCAPCIPEMDSLTKFQNKFSSKVQVIAISNDTRDRLQKYLLKRPTKIPMVSDTTNFLYRNVGFSYVGQSIILNRDKQIIAMVKTDSISSQFMERLLAGKKVPSTAEFRTGTESLQKDPFGVDSTTESNICLRSYMPDYSTMSMSYGGAQKGRRVSYFNTCITVLYKDAYDITSMSQVIYEADENKVCNFNDKSTLICFDFMVRGDQKDSFKLLMQKTLNNILPYKARIEYRVIPVLLLKRNNSELLARKSEAMDSTYGFSGRGFTGKAVHMATFANYLNNELRLPVIDETGLTGRYDIKTEYALRTKEEVIAGIGKIGFQTERSERRMPVLIIY